jgi:hypothetical protein
MARTKSTTAAGEKKATTRSKKAAAPSPAPSNGTGVEIVNNVEERIRARAYELYEGRGRQHGAHEHDWFVAEAEVRSHTA